VAVLAGGGATGWYAWKEYGSARAASGSRVGTVAPVVVDVVAARTGTVIERIEAIGTSRAFESVVITARQTGNVMQINFTEGQRVRAGAVLVELEGRERRADIDQARAARDEIRQQLERARELRRNGVTSEARADQLEAQFRASEARLRAVESRYDDVRITAPFDGRVGMRQVSLGALTQPGQQITTLDDISRIRIDFNIPEVHIGRLREGLNVTARSSAFTDRAFTGQVTVIDTRVDPATRSVRVSAVFPNPDETLRPGMFLNVELGLVERPNAIIVPEEAVVSEGTKQFAMVVRDNRIDRREIRVGQRQPGEAEVVQGLREGELVVVRGIQRVRPGLVVAPRPLQPNT
jgi:membrane fusion protein (multidrug efflux system)